MDERMKERVEGWDSRPFDGGYDGLSDLASADFSGGVTTGVAWLFMLNGRIVGVVDGSIQDFEGASGTVNVAPDSALPLLSVMKSIGGETRAKYYTNETSVREVDRTLKQGSFTGYVELSEGVLSGDYYLVYYGGERMAVAFIGNAERLKTGDEAFELAADEVGIYEVIDAEIDVTDVPGSHSSGSEMSAETGDDVTGAETPRPDTGVNERDNQAETSSTGTAGSKTADDSDPAIDSSEANGGTAASGTDDPTSAESTPAEATTTSFSDAESAPESSTAPDLESDAAFGDDFTGSGTDEADVEPAPAPGDDEAVPTAGAGTGVDSSDDGPGLEEIEAAAEELGGGDIPWADDDPIEDESDLEEEFKREERWRETRSIPSLDPDRTGDDAGPPDGVAGGESPGDAAAPPSQQNIGGRSSGGQATAASASTEDKKKSSPTSTDGERTARLQRQLASVTQERDDLRERAQRLESERDQYKKKARELSETVERLRERLENGVDTAESGPSAVGRSTHLGQEEAIAATNLFVRYNSKSQATLESAHDGEADRSTVNENLQLQHHVGFSAEDAVVDGEPFETFLERSMEYRFIDWLTGTFLYEIRDTGCSNEMEGLYDVIPRIDRAEFQATISLEDDDTQDVPDQVSFDAVAFDKMGNPLVVCLLNDSREPASREMLEAMEEAASAVKANYPGLGGAMVVTSSYFEPGALEVTEQATGGGFLSRTSKLSYISLSRKIGGYHLNLIEDRDGSFHVTVPEL